MKIFTYVTETIRHFSQDQGCQIFLWPKWLFFEKVVAKITKSFNYGNLHSDGKLKMFVGSIFFAKKNLDLPTKEDFPLN